MHITGCTVVGLVENYIQQEDGDRGMDKEYAEGQRLFPYGGTHAFLLGIPLFFDCIYIGQEDAKML